MKRIILSIFAIILLLSNPTMAHSGRTDASGGHRDNKNVSGLGSYHYHHGYGPHLHPGGVCPYEAPSEPPKPSKPVTIDVKSVRIIDSVNMDSIDTSLQVGEIKELKAVISPENATDKSITWSSSDKSIATVSDTGVITAHSSGTAVITALAASGEAHSIDINVNEENEPAAEVTASSKSINVPEEKEEESGSPIVGAGILAFAAAFFYSRRKKNKR